MPVAASICALFFTPATGTQLSLNTQDFAPFNYEVKGVVSGPPADVIRKVCEEMKIDCPMTLLPWRRAQQEVDEGKINGMFVIGWNAERAKSLYFSPPLLDTEYGFFVRDDNPLAFKQNADVKGYVVGVFGPSNTATALQKIKAELQDLTIDMTPDDLAAFRRRPARSSMGSMSQRSGSWRLSAGSWGGPRSATRSLRRWPSSPLSSFYGSRSIPLGLLRAALWLVWAVIC